MLYGWKTNFCLCLCTILSLAIGSSARSQQSAYQNRQSNVGQDEQFSSSGSNQQDPARQGNQNAIQSLTPQQQAAMERAAQQQADENFAESKVIPAPQRPFPELASDELDYLNKFLDYWQQSSQQVEQYICDFRRYEYDPSIVNFRDPTTHQLAAHSIAVGEIRYADPDKGRYETTQIWEFKSPPQKAGEDADYSRRGDESEKERWICDGRNIYEFDFSNKRLYESEIPKEMQGEAIVNSPLPFLFGADKKQIQERYWVRVIPKSVETEYWLEAYPKRIEDARIYSKIEVILAKEDFLPKAMHVYSPQYDPAKNNLKSQYYAFENRRVNDQLSQIKDFFGYFVRPQTPIIGGWKRVNRSALMEQQSASLPTGVGSGNPQASDGTIR